jgi:hypothetical protein
MNTLDFLLEGLIYEAVLLYYRDPLKCLARNSNGVEGPTATYNENKKSEYTRFSKDPGSWVAHQRHLVRATRRVGSVLTACRKLLVHPHQASRVMMMIPPLPPPPFAYGQRQQCVGEPAGEVMVLPFE